MDHICTFAEDLLGLSEFARRLEAFIKVEQHFVEGGLVVALSARFGSGKTTFLRMWRSSIKAGHSECEDAIVVSLNAWESDYYGDPLFAIVSGLAECVKQSGESEKPLLEAAKDVGWFATAVGSQIVNKVTGIDPTEAGALAEEKRAARRDSGPQYADTFSLYEGRKDAMASLKRAIAEFVEGCESHVLFLVDELDRCRPDYAISYLETIKHIFDIPGAVFILAADREQLESSARMAFGNDLDFDEYYRKFIHREVTLPPISEAEHKRLAREYVDRYLAKEDMRTCYMNMKSNHVEQIAELVGALQLTPRQIQEVFRILGHLFQTSKDNEGRLLWGIAAGSIAMAAFKTAEPEIFHLLGTRNLDPKEAVAFLRRLFAKPFDVQWWFKLLLTGNGLQVDEGISPQDVVNHAGLWTEDEGEIVPLNMHEWRSGWGHTFTNRFPQIYDKIMYIDQWQ